MSTPRTPLPSAPQPPLAARALLSNVALQRMYELRQQGRDQGGERKRAAVIICLVLLAITATLLITTSWVPHDVTSYVETRTGIHNVDPAASTVSWMTSVTAGDCSVDERHCYQRLAKTLQASSLSTIDTFTNNTPSTLTKLVRLTLPRSIIETATAGVRQPVVVVSLPRFSFRRARLFVDGAATGLFWNGDRVTATLDVASLPTTAEISFDAFLELQPSDRTIAGLRNGEGILVASQGEFERYRDFLGAKNTNAAGQLGQVAKIVLALFCLLLFLIVDSSAESLGLALFMGFEAAAMGIGSGWLPLGYFGIENVTPFVHYCYQMGDLLKLYFLFQMARVGPSRVAPWLIIGTLASVPYGFFMDWAAHNDINWTYKIARSRDTIVGTLGALVCLRVLWTLRAQSLPWRKTALVTAAIAAAFEVLNTWMAHSDWIRIYPAMRTAYTVFQANCGYLFALSTFLNISTLENRVRALTKAKARADEIERELEIGQIVQQALLRPPELPASVDLRCHHEAALYVSGDTYYAYWDKVRSTFSFLVNDVTGHGVQAALKASACNVLARTIWEDEDADIVAMPFDGARLAEYDRVTAKLLVEMDSVPDFNSLIGAELHTDTGELAVYRSNFTFPILIEPHAAISPEMEPKLGEMWRPELLVSRNRELVRRKLVRGSFLLFLSDGFMESSRDGKLFTTYLRRQLSQRDARLSCEAITDLVLRYEGFKKRKIVDDRTLIVFQWTHPGMRAKKSEPETTLRSA